MRREAREVWVKRVERWRDSGLTAKEYATELGVNYQTLQYWKYKLDREERDLGAVAVTGGAVAAPPASPSTLGFIELSAAAPSGQPSRLQNEGRFELELRGGIRLFVPPAFDSTALSRLLALVESRA